MLVAIVVLERAALRSSDAAHVPRLPGADLGRAAAGPARRHRGRGRRRRASRSGRRRGGWARSRTQSITDSILGTQLYIARRPRSRPCAWPPSSPSASASPSGSPRPRPARRDRRHRAPADRAQPPRRRAAAPHGARSCSCASPPSRRARSPRRAPGLLESRRGRARRWRSTSCASSRTASTRPCSRRSGSIRRSRRWRPRVGDPDPAARAARRARLDPTAEATAYFVASEARDQRAQARGGHRDHDLAAVASRGVLHVEIADDGRGGADEAAGVGAPGAARSRRGDRRHASTSPALPARARGCVASLPVRPPGGR